MPSMYGVPDRARSSSSPSVTRRRNSSQRSHPRCYNELEFALQDALKHQSIIAPNLIADESRPQLLQPIIVSLQASKFAHATTRVFKLFRAQIETLVLGVVMLDAFGIHA